MKRSVEFTEGARMQLRTLTSDVQERLLKKIGKILGSETSSNTMAQIEEFPGLWSLFIGDFRLVVSLDENRRTALVVSVRRRVGAKSKMP